VKAIYIERHGPPSDLKVSDVPIPDVKPGQVLVHVEAAGINPSDLGSVEGRFPDSVLPRIVGRDFAGTVVKGPSSLVGMKVWGSGGDLGVLRDGTDAEFLAIPEKAAPRRPRNLSAEQAAAVGVPFITAFAGLVRLAKVKEGEWVIVSGAAGGVGQAAIEVAHAKGARVIALIKNASQLWVSESKKVQAVARSDQGDLETVTRKATEGKGADVAMNGVGSSIFPALQACLGFGGRHVVYSVAGGKEVTVDLLTFYKHQAALLGLDTQKFDATQCAEILSELAPLFESGAMEPPKIAETYRLADAAKAYGRVAAGTNGKVVFTVQPQAASS
jgi:NADPH:quinone reductase